MLFSLLKWLKEDYGDLLSAKVVSLEESQIKAINE
jgi:hypothetical protein